MVSVRDNGAGIDPEVIPKLFTKFTTWPSSIFRTNGIGLGLYQRILSKVTEEAFGLRIIVPVKEQHFHSVCRCLISTRI